MTEARCVPLVQHCTRGSCLLSSALLTGAGRVGLYCLQLCSCTNGICIW